MHACGYFQAVREQALNTFQALEINHIRNISWKLAKSGSLLYCLQKSHLTKGSVVGISVFSQAKYAQLLDKIFTYCVEDFPKQIHQIITEEHLVASSINTESLYTTATFGCYTHYRCLWLTSRKPFWPGVKVIIVVFCISKDCSIQLK